MVEQAYYIANMIVLVACVLGLYAVIAALIAGFFYLIWLMLKACAGLVAACFRWIYRTLSPRNA